VLVGEVVFVGAVALVISLVRKRNRDIQAKFFDKFLVQTIQTNQTMENQRKSLINEDVPPQNNLNLKPDLEGSGNDVN
jgi:hypothetical protein